MRIRFLPFMIYASIFALIARLENIVQYKKEIFSLVSINDLNANPEESENNKEPSEHKTEEKSSDTEKKDEKISTEKPKEFDCNKASYSSTDLILLQNLSKRREELEKKNSDIAIRETLLKAAEIKLENKSNELKNLKIEIDNLLSQYNKQEDTKINSLVKIYENMKPKEAAKIFNGLEMPLLLEVLGKMKEAKSAQIMSQMDPNKATEITEKYAEQKKIIVSTNSD